MGSLIIDLIWYSPTISPSLCLRLFSPLFSVSTFTKFRTTPFSPFPLPYASSNPLLSISSILLLPLVTSYVPPSCFPPLALLLLTTLRVRLERAKDVVPQHEVLPVIRFGEPMVYIVVPHLIQSTAPPARRHVEPSVVQRSQKTS